LTYDVVVAGGSFAGLVVATSVGGRVALVERGEVGEGQTSACATTLDLVQKLGLEASIEEVHETAVFHHRRGGVRLRLPYRFCTFDYRTFCRLLLERFDGDLIRSPALGVRGSAVVTGSGDLEGRALVDATGWRATLAASADPRFPVTAARTYGLERPVRGFEPGGLHFWFDAKTRADGYAWAFPAGDVARAGLLSYVAATGVRDATARFLDAGGLLPGPWHGGYLTAGLRPALAGPVFTVGDAAGHCLPLTGEGIRPAVFFAQRLAALLERERAGAATRAETRAAWAALQASFRRRYALLRAAQTMLRGWPDPPLGVLFRWFAREGGLHRWASRAYWDLAAPITRGKPSAGTRSAAAAAGVTAPADAIPAAPAAGASTAPSRPAGRPA
jgi:flavin-dependent dehydrogenase